MSTYTDASLIVTPNAVKDGKLYSLKGADLDVVRNTTATYVGADGLIKTALANVPRLDYTNGSCPSVLVEPQRTNLFLQTQNFTTSWGFLRSFFTPNLVPSPIFGVNSGKLIANTELNTHTIFANPLISDVNTISFFAKASEINELEVSIQGINSLINISTGAILINGLNVTINVFNYGDGWFRFSFTYNFISTSNQLIIRLSKNGNSIFLGNNIEGAFIIGAQLETGSNATSYIPTTTTAITRNADVISKSGLTGITTITETFEDDTTNVISGSPTTYTMSEGRIKNVIGL